MTKREVYQYYSHETLEKVEIAVKCGQLSIRKAAAEFHVPKTTVHDHVTGKIEVSVKPGRPPALSLEVEGKIVKTAMDAAACGFSISRAMLQCKTGQLVQRMKLNTPVKNGVPENRS